MAFSLFRGSTDGARFPSVNASELRTPVYATPCPLISLKRFREQGQRCSGYSHAALSDCRSFSSPLDDGSRTSRLPFVSADDEAVWDVLGLGQAMVDFAASVDDKLLEELGVEKGGRRIITVEERAKILEMLDSSSYQISAGGSLANTLANLARLGVADATASSGVRQPLRIAAASIAGSDALGSFHTAQQEKAGVTTISQPLLNSGTGTVIVLTTPDANRTFLSYLGAAQELDLPPEVTAAIRQSRLVAVEGYLWEMPQAAAAIQKVVELAHASGATVVLTAGDANVVKRHRKKILDALTAGVDILFANRAEAEALLERPCSAEDAALSLGPHCSMVVITDGANGSCISAMGRLQVIPPFWAMNKPVDTCGAGDAYAAGLIYGWLMGMDPPSMGRCGARVASTVIGKSGAGVTEGEAASLIKAFLYSCLGPLDFKWAANFSNS